MASILAPIDARDYAKKYIGNMDLERFDPRMLDDVNKMFWTYAPWRWSLGLMPQVTLLSNTQDYPVTLPSDFLYLYDMLQLDGKTTRHIKPSAIWPSTGVSLKAGQGGSVAVMTNDGTNFFYRLDVTPGQIPATALPSKLVGIYKLVAPTITISNMLTTGAQVFPDEYFWAYQEGVLWKAMAWAQDPRAGDVKFQGGQAAYSGQRAAFEAAMAEVAMREKLYYGDKQEDDK